MSFDGWMIMPISRLVRAYIYIYVCMCVDVIAYVSACVYSVSRLHLISTRDHEVLLRRATGWKTFSRFAG